MSSHRQIFEFDPIKAASNLKKHGVSFAEAMTIFDDPRWLPRCQMISTPMRKIASSPSACPQSTVSFSSFTLTPSPASVSSEPVLQPQPRLHDMKKSPELDPLAPWPALDFSKGIRGKHHARVQQGTNIVLIAPDLLETFPDSEAVNEALRSLKRIAERTTKPAPRKVSRTTSKRSTALAS